MLQIGLRLHDARKQPLEPLLAEVSGQGFTCAHLALTKLLKEVPCNPSSLTPGYAMYLKHAFAAHGLDIAVLGNYLNLANPDEAKLRDIQEMYYAHIRFASLLGCAMVGTETGAPNTTYTSCPECRSDEALSTFIRNLRPVVRCAEQFGVLVAIEPVAKHIVYNGARARRVLDEIGSHNLQILFDPVNLLDMSNVDRREEVFAEMIELCGPDIGMLHLKDCVFENGGLKSVGATTGEMDYTSVLRWVKKEKPFLFATLENTTPENAEQCRLNIRRIYDEV